MSQISDGTRLQETLETLLAAQLCIPASHLRIHAALSMPTDHFLRYFFRENQDRDDGRGGNTLRHLIYAATQMKMYFRVMEGLVTELSAREQLQLLDESIMGSVLSLGRSLVQSSHLTLTIREVLERQC